VLGIHRAAAVQGRDRGVDPAGEPCRYKLGKVRRPDVAELGDLAVLERDPAEVVIVQCAAVEDVEDLIAFVVGGCPVGDEEPAERRSNTQFLPDFAGARGVRRFAGLDVPTGEVPEVFVRGSE